MLVRITLFIFLLCSSTLFAQNSFGFSGNTQTTLFNATGWWKIKAAVPVKTGNTTITLPLWGYIGFEQDKTGETWECGHNGQTCLPGTLIKFTWTESNGHITWTSPQGFSGTMQLTWIDQNTFTVQDKNYLKTFYRAVDGTDAKCNWHMAIWNANCKYLPTPCANETQSRGTTGCGSCQYGCRDCSTCSGTGNVWDAQVGKWYPCTGYGCGIFAPRGKICK